MPRLSRNRLSRQKRLKVLLRLRRGVASLKPRSPTSLRWSPLLLQSHHPLLPKQHRLPLLQFRKSLPPRRSMPQLLPKLNPLPPKLQRLSRPLHRSGTIPAKSSSTSFSMTSRMIRPPIRNQIPTITTISGTGRTNSDRTTATTRDRRLLSMSLKVLSRLLAFSR